MELRDILSDMEASMEKSASAKTTAPSLNPTKDDSRDVEKQASTQALAQDLESGIDNLLASLDAPAEGTLNKVAEEGTSDDLTKASARGEEKKEDKEDEEKEKGEKSGDDSEASSEEETSQEKEASTNPNLDKEDIEMLNKLASKGVLQRFSEEQIMDHELSKQAGYQLALETVAREIEKVGGAFEKTASVEGFHAAIDDCVAAGHLKAHESDLGLLKSAADTQIAQSYLDTLVTKGHLTSEGQAMILNSLAQVAEINEETIAKAVAGLDPEQAAAAQQALMDQFVQRNTTPAPAGAPMMPAEQPQPPVGGTMVAPVLGPAPSEVKPDVTHGPAPEGTAPVPVKGEVKEQEKKAAAWDQYADGLIAEASAFEKLAAANPELWAMVNSETEKQASSVDPVEEYYANYLRDRGYIS